MNKLKIELPEEIKKSSDKIKQAYVDWCTIADKIQNYPKRFLLVPDPENSEETKTVDLIQAWGHCNKKISHLNKDTRAKAKSIWNEILMLKNKKGQYKRLWTSELKNTEKGSKIAISTKYDELLDLFGKWLTLSEVYNTVKNEWGFHWITKKELNDFRVKNQDRIEIIKTEWESKSDHFYLAKKRGRIEQLGYLFHTQREKYEDSDHNTSYSKELRSILDQIRKEIEGEKISIDINGNINIDATLNANKTLKQVYSEISINNMIIGLVAAKKGLNPATLIKDLSESIYNQYNGFNGRLEDGEIQDLSMLPSNMLYDWQKLERIHKEKQRIKDESEIIQPINETNNKGLKRISDSIGIKDNDYKSNQGINESESNTSNDYSESVNYIEEGLKESEKPDTETLANSQVRKKLTELIDLKRLNG